MNKHDITHILDEIAFLKELLGENMFKVRAFQNAVRVLESDPREIPELVETGELEKLKGIGKGLSAVIRDLVKTGKSQEHIALKKQFPAGLLDLTRIQGLGAKRIKGLYDKLDIKSVGELEYACKENRLVDLDGFGEKSQRNILASIEHFKKSRGHFLLPLVREEAAAFCDYLKKKKGCDKIEIAGSLRRHKEIVKDIDILVSTKTPEAIHNAFAKYPEVESVLAHGDTKSSVILKSGVQCDLRTVSAVEFPYALYYFTGSKEHNVAVRTIAKRRGIKINEYGLFRGKKLIPCKSEEDIFKTLGFNYIPPELRENTGEIEAAAKKKFAPLIRDEDIRGVFHVHSNYSDGSASLERMVVRAQELGYEYIGISDHSQSAFYARGLKEDRVKAQWKEIDRLQKKVGIRIFKGIESDILPDGRLDYPDALLAQFDFVIGSVHSRFQMPGKEMTKRMMRAVQNKYLTFVGHPTGRLLLGRDGYQVNLTQIIDEAKKCGVVPELNANPQRLDLDWRMCQYAKKKGVQVGIHPDAHSPEGLEDVSYGVGIARKGWLEKKDVLNTMPCAEIEKFLAKRR
ncbi:MAG: DNA polymerase/3'-5' exonuclease PolX [Candidatus Omnitrophota bacterium]|nr:DNA polymerase/3'-5' exonuclease PolX [Candidatus Omnitrophota bacterium]